MINLKKISSEYLFAIIFFVFSIILEIASLLTVSEGACFLPKYFLFDFTFICIICSLLILVRNKIFNSILSLFFLTIQVVLNVVNAALYKTFGYVFDYSMLNLGQEGKMAFEPQFINWLSVAINLILLVLAFYFVINICKKTETSNLHSFKSILCVFVAFFVFSTTGLSSLLLAKTTMVDAQEDSALYIAQSDVYAYDNMHFSLEAYKKFGVYGYYMKTLEDLIFKNDKLSEAEKEEYVNYLKEGEVLEDPTKLLYDDNLILIMLESFEWFAIDPYNTPTLYNLKENLGVSYEEFYAWNKTNTSEEISILGNIPEKHTLISLSQNNKLNPQYSLAKLFSDRNYESKYFHSYKGDFYQRNRINMDFGFSDVITLEDTNIPNKQETLETFGNWQKESDFLESVIEDFVPKDRKFFSYYTTVGTHGPYKELNPRLTDLALEYDSNFNLLEEYYRENTNFITPTNSEYLNYLKNYKVAAMDTDRMLEYLLNYLDENNLSENTTIVLFSDHSCYYNDLSSVLKFGTKNIDENSSEVYNIPFLIYSKKISPQKNCEFCSTYDIYPTICDLFGLKYNKNLTQGYSTFQDEIENTVFVSSITGIFTNKLYTKNILDVYDFNQQNISDNEIFNFQLHAVNFYKKQEKIDKIYFNNITI